MKDLPQSLRRIWEIISGDEYPAAQQRFGRPWPIYAPPRWLSDGELNPIARTEILRQLEPFLHFKARSVAMKELEDRELSSESERRISYYVEVQVGLAARDHVKSIVDSIDNDARRIHLLADLADDLTSLLKKAIDLFAAAGKANRDDDPSWADQPSISSHPQNRHFHEWSYLIDLVRDSFTAVAQVKPASANALLERWNTIEYPVFRRLVVHGLTEWTLQQQ